MGFWTCLWTFPKCFEVQGWEPSHCLLTSLESRAHECQTCLLLLCSLSRSLFVTHWQWPWCAWLTLKASFGLQSSRKGCVLKCFVYVTISPLISTALPHFLTSFSLQSQRIGSSTQSWDLECSSKFNFLLDRNLSHTLPNPSTKVYWGLLTCT